MLCTSMLITSKIQSQCIAQLCVSLAIQSPKHCTSMLIISNAIPVHCIIMLIASNLIPYALHNNAYHKQSNSNALPNYIYHNKFKILLITLGLHCL